MDARPSDTRDLSSKARECVRIQPAPDWIVPCPYDADFKTEIRGPATYLLLEQQVNAELGETYLRHAVRLETMQAVQHQSQWRVEFEPQTQSVVLHSIKIRRGSTETEHASLDRIQFLQREAGLEGFVIDGWITLLLLLEDVSPGDILEWSYTLTNRPRLLPGHTHFLFSFPSGVQVGKYHFSVGHSVDRKLNWKSSSVALAPTVSPEGRNVRLFWLGEKLSSPEPEDCMPAGYIGCPWMQISDCPDWQTVANAFLQSWKEDAGGESLARLIDEVRSAGQDPASRINRALELVQDKFRYLSVSSELGGQIPAPAESVIRRRYGDCKDLAFLLVRLLRAVGVPARPVLVNAVWQKSISLLLPSPGVFNHAIVEFEINNERRWVDPTLKHQGGGALNRFVPDYGLGLPIDANASALMPVPPPSLPTGTMEFKESFLLDTSGRPSALALIVIARGVNAENFRREFENEGVDAMAKKRLQMVADRFSQASRFGPLRYRDDRERNEFVIAESFEISGFLTQDSDRGTCLFFFQGEVGAALACPTANRRHAPFALPFPCQHMHVVEVNFAGMDLPAIPVIQFGNEFFSFSRRSKVVPKFLRATFSMSTRTGAVLPEKMPEFQSHVEALRKECGFQVRLPVGYKRMRTPADFGALPTPIESGAISGQSTVRPPADSTAAGAPSGTTAPAPSAADELRPARAAAAVAERPALASTGAAGASRRAHSRRRHSSSYEDRHYSGSRSVNFKSLWAIAMLVGALLGFGAMLVLGRNPATRLVAGLMFPVVAGAWMLSMVLAIIGLVQGRKRSSRSGDGKTIAIITLVFGALFGAVVILPLSVAGLKGGINAARRGKQMRAGSEDLKFTARNFLFRTPGMPWRQVDARNFGNGPVLALARPEPMYFTVVANQLKPGIPNPMPTIVELSKANVRSMATSYQLLREGEVTVGKMAGWQTEAEASIQGHEYFMVHWLFAADGFGYQLAVWGPKEMAAGIKAESERLFEGFQLTHGEE